MLDPKYVLTPQGLKDTKKELDHRVNVLRPAIADKIFQATEQGDLSENAAYSAAMEEQHMNESKILELMDIVQNVQVARNTSRTSVDIGEQIVVQDMTTKKKYTYVIVGEEEADPIQNRISFTSPMGRAFLGKKEGDIVAVELPTGPVKYKLISFGK